MHGRIHSSFGQKVLDNAFSRVSDNVEAVHHPFSVEFVRRETVGLAACFMRTHLLNQSMSEAT